MINEAQERLTLEIEAVKKNAVDVELKVNKVTNDLADMIEKQKAAER